MVGGGCSPSFRSDTVHVTTVATEHSAQEEGQLIQNENSVVRIALLRAYSEKGQFEQLTHTHTKYLSVAPLNIS